MLIGRGRCARGGAVRKRATAGSYLVPIRTISPGAPTRDPHFLFALPTDRTLNPLVDGAGLDYVFLFPDACVLTHARLHGNPRTLRSFNTLGVRGPTPHDVDLYVNGERVATLLTLSAGAADVDIHSAPDVAIAAGSEVQFIVPVATNAGGAIMNFLFAFAIG